MSRRLAALLLALIFLVVPPHPGARAHGAQKVRATAYVFLATDCPVAGRYGPRLAQLARSYRARGVRFVLVFPNERESAVSVRKWVTDRKLASLAEICQSAELARKWNATISPQVVLTNAGDECRYFGRLDNADDPAKVTRRDLALALDAVLTGGKVVVAQTKPFGCDLALASGKTGDRRTTLAYSPVQAILQKHCVACHQAGEIGPMALTEYATVVGFAKKIAQQTASGQMPPWKAVGSAGVFHDENTLTDAEKKALADWAASSPSPLPATEKTHGEMQKTKQMDWHLGKPDAVFTMPDYDIPAEGKDVYRCFVLPAGNPDEDRWVKGIEFQPGNKSIVHHASVFIDLSGAGRKKDDADPLPGYTNPTPGNGPGFGSYLSVLGGWTPGHLPRKLPFGVAVFLPKGAELVLEVHYHLTGKPEKDRTRFGVHWATEPIDKKLQLGSVGSQKFQIPASAKNYKIEAEQTLSDNVTVLSITPHMHERGRRMIAYAELPSGERRKIIKIDRWDFQWQPSYRFKEPLTLPRGTKVTVEGYFDNSTNKPISWGESTADEMCVTFFAFTRDDEHLLDEPVIIRQ